MFRRRALRRRLGAAGAPSVPDDQLRRLARALDAGPAATECVPADTLLRLAVTRAFRFPDIRDLSELRRSPYCTEHQCCNPYHWSRLCKPGTFRPLTRATSGINIESVRSLVYFENRMCASLKRILCTRVHRDRR